MFLDKGLGICCVRMLYHVDNLCSTHIQVDNPNRDRRDIRPSTNILHFDIVHYIHMVMGRMDRRVWELKYTIVNTYCLCRYLHNNLTLRYWRRIANRKRISIVTRDARASRNMHNHRTSCTYSTRSWTWILTFLSDARLTAEAILIYGAFRPAVWWRSNIRRQTRARRNAVVILTMRILPTWRWITRISFFNNWILLWSC